MDAGAKPAAVGGAYSSLADGVNALYYNPAGLGKVNYKEATFMHNDYMLDMKYEYIAYCMPIEKLKGAMGINVSIFDAGKFDKTRITGGVQYTSLGTFSARDLAVGIGYGKAFNKKYSVGVNLKIISSKIDNAKASAVAADFGMLYENSDADFFPIALGITAQNLGTSLKYDNQKEHLPWTVKVGLSTYFDVDKTIKIIPSFDQYTADGLNYEYKIGCEINIKKIYSIRVGYDSINEIGNGISLGFGAKINAISLDYAFMSYKDLDDAHRISVSYRF